MLRTTDRSRSPCPPWPIGCRACRRKNGGDIVTGVAARTGVDMELFATRDIAGDETLAKLKHGAIAYMEAAGGDSWALRRLDADYVLAHQVRRTRRAARPVGMVAHHAFLRGDRPGDHVLDLAADARPARAGEGGGAVRQPELVVQRRVSSRTRRSIRSYRPFAAWPRASTA